MKFVLGAGALLLVTCAVARPSIEPRLMRTPAIHGQTIVFSYAGDLWVTKTGSGNVARRLTSHPALEISPMISPDGRHVAFQGSYDGASEIYVIPVEGGEPRRVTYEAGANLALVNWTPDGKIAYGSTTGNRSRLQYRLWFADPRGGLPTRTPLAEVGEGSFMPDGKTIAYTRASMYRIFSWRRYRGGLQGRIALYNIETGSYSELPAGREQNYAPMAVGGSIYYISDKNLATLNLYRYDLASKRSVQLTSYSDADIRNPRTDGKSIVWERDGFLDAYDIATGKVERQAPRILSEQLGARPALKKLADNIGALQLSPHGTRVLVEARGRLFTLSSKEGDTQNLTASERGRESSPVWSPDGKSIAFVGDATGQEEVYIRPARGGAATRLTSANGSIAFTGLKWAPDSKKLEVRSRAGDIYILHMGSTQLEHVAKLREPGGASDWAPDSSWLAFIDLEENLLGAVHLYDLRARKVHQATSGFYWDSDVAFDRNGRFLYVRSTRAFNPGFGRFEYSLNVSSTDGYYLIPLSSSARNPLRESVGEEGASSQDDADTSANVRIDLEGFEQRMVRLPIPLGSYVGSAGVKNGLLYVQSTPAGFKIARFDLPSRESRTIYEGRASSLAVSHDQTHFAIRNDSKIELRELKPGASASEISTTDLEAWIDPREEWRQIFWDAWRYIRDTFYDPNMLGLDWLAVGRRYEGYLPHIAHREDLNFVLDGMFSELATSHGGAFGGDTGAPTESIAVGRLGADYELAGAHVRIAKVYKGENFDPDRRGPLAEPGFIVNEGEYLLEIDGRPVRANTHPAELLLGKAGEYVTLTVNTTPTLAGARKVRVKTIASEDKLRYADWVARTREYVADKSGGRIGYMHLPNVVHEGAGEFIRAFYGQSHVEALIVDERWNSGGFLIQQLLVDTLARRNNMGLQFRNAADQLGGFAIQGPKAMLINEYAGSGGDSLPWTFRDSKLGPLIGRRTSGGLVGQNGMHTLVDGGGMVTPEVGLYDVRTGLLAAENVGIEPDIEVDQRPDLVAGGQDPQLDAAIKYLLEELKKHPKRVPRKEIPRVMPPGRIGG